MSNSSQRAAQACVLPHATAALATSANASSTNLRRRRFLLALGAGGAGAAAVATQPLVAPLAEPVVGAADAAQGYRETDHVRRYYATTRI